MIDYAITLLPLESINVAFNTCNPGMSNLCNNFRFLKSQLVVETVGVASNPVSYLKFKGVSIAKLKNM
jgi:hypothetical protein